MSESFAGSTVDMPNVWTRARVSSRSSQYESLPGSFFTRSARDVAPELLGRLIVRMVKGRRLVLRIVETEAYLGIADRASHAFGGRRTARTESLFLPGGHAYVYLIYGMYHCLNVVTGNETDGEAVLIRAGEPVEGESYMIRNRKLQGSVKPGAVAGGPGRLSDAIAVDLSLNRVRIDDNRGPLRIAAGEPTGRSDVATGPRIGIDYAGEAMRWPLRFAVRGHAHVSRPYPW